VAAPSPPATGLDRGRARTTKPTADADRRPRLRHDNYRRLVWKRGIKPLIARRQTEHASGLGRNRWVVERTFAWLHNRRRLLIPMFTAAKFAFSCVASQNGFVLEWPQRQRAIVSSTWYSLPSASRSVTPPWMR
jgi:hypothetical protein